MDLGAFSKIGLLCISHGSRLCDVTVPKPPAGVPADWQFRCYLPSDLPNIDGIIVLQKYDTTSWTRTLCIYLCKMTFHGNVVIFMRRC